MKQLVNVMHALLFSFIDMSAHIHKRKEIIVGRIFFQMKKQKMEQVYISTINSALGREYYENFSQTDRPPSNGNT
jgi:hypothetical protein